MKRIAINENGIHMVFEVRRDKVRLVHFSALPLDENTLVRQGEKDLYFPSEIQVTGRNRPSNWHGAKIVETSPGYEMKYLDFRDSRNDTGRKLEWETVHEETGLHLSTVSRACAHKYYEFNGRIRPFSDLLCKALHQISRDRIEAQLKRWIAEEDPAVPLDDEQLALRFQNEGVVLSRRRIADVRKRLNISNSYQRKNMKKEL
mgnify:CR=1 FL=1